MIKMTFEQVQFLLDALISADDSINPDAYTIAQMKIPEAIKFLEVKIADTERHFPPTAYANIDPAYELLDDGSVRHRETLVVRPKFYSDLPIPFKVGQKVKVVDANWQFPLGTIGTITNIIQGVVYFNSTAICWERLDLVEEACAP